MSLYVHLLQLYCKITNFFEIPLYLPPDLRSLNTYFT